MPSRYESEVVRRTVPWLTASAISSISFTPLHRLKGIITPNGLVFERYHGGVPEIDPAEHRLMIHGLVDRPLIFSMDDLMRFPSVSVIRFIECPANGGIYNAGMGHYGRVTVVNGPGTWLGDGETLAFIRHERVAYVRSIETLDGGDRRVVYRAPTTSRLTSLAFDASSRLLVFATIRANAGLWAVPLDQDGAAAEAQAQLLIPRGLAPSIASDGPLVYVHGLRVEPARLARVERSGKMIGEAGQALWDMDRPVASPDGSRVGVIATHSGSREIWVQDLERDTALRVTTDSPQNISIAWADEGESIVYAISRGGTSQLVKQRADGEGEPTVLIEGQVGRPSMPRDGSVVVYQVGGSRLRKGPGDIWCFPIGHPDEAAPLIATPADEVQPAVSPDGQLLAYSSDESQRYEVYLRPLAGDGKRLRVSAQGGVSPFWALDGSELYYIEDATLIAVRVGPDGKSLGSPERLFSGTDVSSPLVQNGIASITVGPDGHFIVVQNRIPGSPRVVTVENWKRLLED